MVDNVYCCSGRDDSIYVDPSARRGRRVGFCKGYKGKLNALLTYWAFNFTIINFLNN